MKRLLVALNLLVFFHVQGAAAMGLLDRAKGMFDAGKEQAAKAVDAVKNAAGQASDACGEALTAAQKAGQITAQQAARVAESGPAITQALQEVPKMLVSAKDAAVLGVDVTAITTWSAVKAAPGAFVRTIRFGGTVNDVKSGIAVPMLGHFQAIRASSADPAKAAAKIGAFTVFLVEVGFKMQIFAGEQIRAGVWDMIKPSPRPENPSEEGPDHLVAILRQEVLSNVWNTLRDPELTWRERLVKLQDTDEAVKAAVVRAYGQMGFEELQAEVAQWVSENEGESEAL